MRASNLAKAFLRGEYDVVPESFRSMMTEEVQKAWVEDTTRFFTRDGQYFVLADDLDTNDEVYESAKDMVRVGMFRLPYRRCVVEFPPSDSEKIPHTQVLLIEELAPGKPLGMKIEVHDQFGLGRQSIPEDRPLFVVQTFMDMPRNMKASVVSKNEWFNIPVPLIVWGDESSPSSVAGCIPLPELLEKYSGNRVIAEALFNDLRQHMAWISTALCNFVVLMATRGIILERVRQPEGKKRGHAKRPLPDYTIIRIPHASREVLREATRRGHRSLVRLHLRRGHIRHLEMKFDGEMRQTWVRPHLVGYKEQGTLLHEYTVKKGKGS